LRARDWLPGARSCGRSRKDRPKRSGSNQSWKSVQTDDCQSRYMRLMCLKPPCHSSKQMVAFLLHLRISVEVPRLRGRTASEKYEKSGGSARDLG
jgi:hypothetical protein